MPAAMQEAPDNEPRQRLQCVSVLTPDPCSLGEGENRLTYINQQPAWHCSFSKDGMYLAVCYGAPDPCIRIWKQRGGDDATGSPDQKKKERRQHSWQLHSTLLSIQTRTIRSVSFAPVTKPLILASASFDGSIAIWEQPSTEDGEWDCMAQLEGHDNEVKDVAWNTTGSLLATCGRDKTVWIWECFLPGTVGGTSDGDFECIAVLSGHEGDVKVVKFADSHGQWGDGDEILLSGSYDDTIRVWAEDAGDWYCATHIQGIHTSTIWTLAVAPSGRRVVSGSADGSLAILKCYSASEMRDTETKQDDEGGRSRSKPAWKCVGKLSEAHSGIVYSVDYAPARVGHGRIVSGGSDNRIQVYQEAIGSTSDKPMFQLDAAADVETGDINCVCWHPWEGSILASCGDDGTVRIWNYQV